MYVSRRYAIYRSDDAGATWILDCYIPSTGWKSLASRIRLGARLLRYVVPAFRLLPDGSRIAVARDGIYHANADETRMTRTFAIERGSRPLNIEVHGKRVLFGEYGDGYENKELFLYVSEDCGRTYEVAHRFEKGAHRHIHNVIWDSYRDHYWVFVGDFDRQPGIGVLSKDLKHFDWLHRGSQMCRVFTAIVEPDCLLYGTDSDRAINYIVRFDKNDGKITKLFEVEGSSLYAARFGPIRAISTCVEPNPYCPSRESVLYASRNGADWNRAIVHRKDRWNPVYFQFGTIVLPYVCCERPQAMYSGQAIRGADDKVRLIDFQ